MIEFNFQDAFLSLPLGDIYPLSARAESWLARASKRGGFLGKPHTQIAGGVFMLSGLDYHHRQFMINIEHLAPYYARKNAFLEHDCELPSGSTVSPPFPTEIERDHLDALHHEAVAYLNRLGQFVYFAKAMELEAMCPRAKDLLSFRNKRTRRTDQSTVRETNRSNCKKCTLWHSTFISLTTAHFQFFRFMIKGIILTFICATIIQFSWMRPWLCCNHCMQSRLMP